MMELSMTNCMYEFVFSFRGPLDSYDRPRRFHSENAADESMARRRLAMLHQNAEDVRIVIQRRLTKAVSI